MDELNIGAEINHTDVVTVLRRRQSQNRSYKRADRSGTVCRTAFRPIRLIAEKKIRISRIGKSGL